MKQSYLLLGVAGAGLGWLAMARAQTPLDNQIKQTEVMVQMQIVARAIRAYAADVDEVYPNPVDLDGLKYAVHPYVKETKLWETSNPNKSEIRFNFSMAGVKATDIQDPAKTVMLYESKEWPNRQRPVALADGSGRTFRSIEWGQAAHTLALGLKRSAEPLPKDYAKKWKELLKRRPTGSRTP